MKFYWLRIIKPYSVRIDGDSAPDGYHFDMFHGYWGDDTTPMPPECPLQKNIYMMAGVFAPENTLIVEGSIVDSMRQVYDKLKLIRVTFSKVFELNYDLDRGEFEENHPFLDQRDIIEYKSHDFELERNLRQYFSLRLPLYKDIVSQLPDSEFFTYKNCCTKVAFCPDFLTTNHIHRSFDGFCISEQLFHVLESYVHSKYFEVIHVSKEDLIPY